MKYIPHLLVARDIENILTPGGGGTTIEMKIEVNLESHGVMMFGNIHPCWFQGEVSLPGDDVGPQGKGGKWYEENFILLCSVQRGVDLVRAG